MTNIKKNPSDQTSLSVDLSPHGSQILRDSQILLWLPLSWLTNTSHFKRRKRFLLRNSNLVGNRGEKEFKWF